MQKVVDVAHKSVPDFVIIMEHHPKSFIEGIVHKKERFFSNCCVQSILTKQNQKAFVTEQQQRENEKCLNGR